MGFNIKRQEKRMLQIMADKKVRICEIVQQLQFLDLSAFCEVLEKNKHVKEYAFIVHDKDRNADGLLKEPHIHCVLRLDNANGFKTIGNWFGVPANCVGRITGRLSDALNYLTHRNAPDKFQYSDDEVVSNFDWKAERKGLKKGSGSEREQEIIEKIASGEIRSFNMSEHITATEYAKYETAINRANKYRLSMLKAETTKGGKKMEVIFIEGSSGSGKTTYAKEIAEKQGYSVCISSSSNDPLQDYDGQDCLILDDLRPDAFAPSDLLKLLDNHTGSSVRSRYYNRWLECRMVIITSVKGIADFTNYFGKGEPPEQLYRRCKTLIRMDNTSLEVLMYNDQERKYESVAKSKNPVAEKYKKQNLAEEEKRKMIAKLPGLEIIEEPKVVEKPKRAKKRNKVSTFDLDPKATELYFPDWTKEG